MVKKYSKSPAKVHGSIFCAARHDDVVIFGRNLWGIGEHKIAETLHWNIHFDFFKNNIRTNVIYNDAHLEWKFIRNNHSAEFKFETA